MIFLFSKKYINSKYEEIDIKKLPKNWDWTDVGGINFVSDVKMGVAAPGVNIFSTIPNNKYSSFNGTSMACPHVAGVLGLGSLERSIGPTFSTIRSCPEHRRTGSLKGASNVCPFT